MLKLTFKIIAGLVLLGVFGTIAVLALINPNDYRDLIEEKAAQQAGLNINIEQELSWSLWPLGFNIKGLYVYDQQGELFTQVESVNLSIDTLSLFTLSPVINGVYASGATINLSTDANGKNNWSQLARTHTAAATPSKESSNYAQHKERQQSQNQQSTEQDQELEQKTSTGMLILPSVAHVQISNINIDYNNLQTQQDLKIRNLQLELQDVALDSTVPVQLSFNAESQASKLHYEHSLEANITVIPEEHTVQVTDLINSIDAMGEFSKGRQIRLSLIGALDYQYDSKQLSAKNVQLSGAGIALDTNFELTTQPTVAIQGNLNIAPFSLASVDKHLGLDLGVNDAAFRSVTLQTPFELKGPKLRLSSFNLHLDQSEFIGRFELDTISQAIDLSLKGDQLTLDNYIVALSKPRSFPVIASAHSRLAAISSPPPANKDLEPLLPLELIRGFTAKVDIMQDRLSYKKNQLSNILLRANTSEGLIEITEFSANIFDGAFSTNATIDARVTHENPRWAATFDLMQFNIEQALTAQDLELPISPAGKLNLSGKVSATGNTLKALKTHNNGKLNASVTDGVIKDINLDSLMCKGFALLANKAVDNSEWGSHTAFETLTTVNTVSNGLIDTKSLKLETGTLSALGSGAFDANNLTFAYGLDLKPTINAPQPACAINEKLTKLTIPLQCEGDIQTAETHCGLNTKSLKKQAVTLAKDESKRKAKKELNRAIEKQLKSKLKGLFN